ncbi:MAG: hypothetical protein IJW70_07710 [Clostridia bacterium]|nr:hypothetical protein [Clostridia bacterium]
MQKKRLVITVVCILLAVLLIGSLFVAAGVALANADNIQFGGLVGELLAGRDEILSGNDSTDSERESLEELETNENSMQEPPYEDTTNTVLPPDPIGLPSLRFFLGGCESWIISGYVYRKTQEFFESGNALEWDHRAVIDDYNVNTVDIWGWAALFEEVPLQLGYKIDGGQSVYDDTAEFYEPAQSSTTAALGMGAISAIGMRVKVPVEHLVGTHTIEIVVRRLGGDEGVICTFEIEKAEPPYVFMADAAYLADMLENGHSTGIESYQYSPGLYPEKGYVRMCPIADFPFPTLNVCPYIGEVYSTGARYLVIKCRKYGPKDAYVNVSSSLPQYEDSVRFLCDGWDWQLIIIDLAQASQIAINGSYDISHLDFILFSSPADQEHSCEIAWIATFRTIEDAQQYDADHPYAKG